MCLDNKHPLKIKIKEEFKLNERYTNNEIADKIRRTLSGILDIKNLTTGGLVEKSNIFIIKKRVRKRVKKEGDKSS